MTEKLERPVAAGAGRPRRQWPWAVALVAMVCLIWGNSLVPGSGSGSLSQAVAEAVRGLLAMAGLPSGWVTNFLVRKTAHFTEYLVLALVAMQALRPHLGRRSPRRWLATAAFLVLVPCLDETIQLFVDGRSGQPLDVLLDCSGALTGVLLTLAVSRARQRRRTGGRKAL